MYLVEQPMFQIYNLIITNTCHPSHVYIEHEGTSAICKETRKEKHND